MALSLHKLKLKTTLYYLGANNRIYEWSIEVDDTTIIIKHGPLNGSKITTYEEIERGKGGRSIYGQIISRVNSRINTQKLKGYKETIAEAQLGRLNALELPKPMLAQPLNKVRNIDIESCFVQYKYDGNRCLITKQDGKVIAYSRKGKIIETIEHITKSLDIPEGIVIDGELYYHGTPLPTIRSWISRKQPNTTKLRYHAYDVVVPLEYKYRLSLLQALKLDGPCSLVPTFKWNELENPSLERMMHGAREQGYEGLILRAEGTGYEVGKRSKSLIKVKSFLDAEFIVTNIYLSEKGMPMATCEINLEKSFDVVLPGSHHEKFMYIKNKDSYIGEILTVEFSQWTPDGIPFHAVAKCWRNI